MKTELFCSKPAHLVLLITLTMLTLSCSGGSGGGLITGGGGGNPPPAPAPEPIPGLCSHAFDPAVSSGVRAVPAATVTMRAPVALSSCTLNANRDVVIGSGGCGPDVYVDKSFTGANGLGAITINSDGQLVFLDRGNFQLDTSGIVVNGKFQIGNSSCSFGGTAKSSKAVVNFTDARAVAGVVKGITVNKGGTLQLYGATGVAAPGVDPHSPSWTYMSSPAGPSSLYGAGMGVASPVGAGGATTLQLADRVDWQPGQWIVVGGTDFSPDGGEFVMINAVSNCAGSTTGTCTVTLDSATPLVHYHFGGPAPDKGKKALSDGASQNYGVDERAEVGLISRNVKLTSTITGKDQHWGGEIVIMAGYNAVEIQGAELEKFGKDQAGSYPIHFHMAGTPAGKTLIDSNSIHHGYNHCITLHATNNVTISNNVCARIVDHLYYLETGTETGNTFVDNLGVGAMSNLFTIAASNKLAHQAFWTGDYLTKDPAQPWFNGYDGFNIPFTDNLPPSAATVVGSTTGNTSSGFWITNPGANKFIGNSISGCQGVGRGFWILPASATIAQVPLLKGNFAFNRAHGCYTGFDTAADDGVTGAFLYTPQGKCVGGVGAGSGLTDCDLIAEFDDTTSTRNRNRGIWVRASWYNLERAHLATNRDGVSLVSSGGTEGSPPGEWGRLSDAVIAGISTNNPNRFGPCPYNGQNGFGGVAGCYEAVQGNGYPDPIWNMFGLMFYDGPARVENVKFVNFNVNVIPYLTAADVSFLNYYSSINNMPCGAPGKFQYEGDAAIGWFQSNLNSYPPTQYTENLSFVNVDLRHQIYTQSVENTCAPSGMGGNFRDGDKFTVILDHDATLTGFQVVPHGGGTPVSGISPISLNNLPFLAGPGTVDECHSTGAQDAAIEQRPTSLISPYSYATLEFSALTAPCNGVPPPATQPNCNNNNVMVFTKDEIDYPNSSGAAQIQFSDQTITDSGGTYTIKCGGSADPNSPGVLGHACVALSGRNGNGIYEPKLVDGLGYTVGANAGMPNFVSLMYGDADLPGGISTANPFQARIGICYRNEGSTAPPATAFTVYKGSKSFSGPNGNLDSLTGFFTLLGCNGLDNVMCGPPGSGTPFCYESLCPSSPYYAGSGTVGAKTQLKQVTSVSQLEDPTVCPNGTCFFYDQTSGLLFINMVQEQANAGGPYSSPLGSCSGSASTSDPACAQENFYSCPGPGCELYTIQVDSSSYTPNGNPSACTPYGGAGGATDYTQPYAVNLNQLAYSSGGALVTTQLDGAATPFPHQAATNEPPGFCPVNAPATPDWPPAPPSSVSTIFTIGLPAGVSVTLSPNVDPIPVTGQPLYPLTQQAYTLMATAVSGTNGCSGANCSCKQNFTVTNTGWTSSGNNCCAMGSGNATPQIGVGGAPYACTGP
jgi:hypothetical protein